MQRVCWNLLSRAILLSCWCFVLLGTTADYSVAAVDKPTEISLYLPIQASRIGGMAEALQLDMQKNNFLDIKIETTEHWHSFQQGLRTGRFGIYFAPPHFAAWAISQHGFRPLARLSESLSYVIATKTADPELFEINDLAGRQICSNKPLNLDYLLINQAMDNSLLSAKVKTVDSVARQMRNPATRCDGFSISNHMFKKISLASPGEFIRLQQGDIYNNYVFLVHPQVSERREAELKRYFLNEKTQSLLLPMLLLFATNSNMVPTDASEYPVSYWQVLAPYWGSNTRAGDVGTATPK